MAYTKADLQSATIRALALQPYGFNLFDQHDSFRTAVREQFNGENVKLDDFNQMVWSLLGQGLIYFHPRGEKVGDVFILLSDTGRLAAIEEETNPDNSSQYIQRIRRTVSETSSIVMLYAEEAIASYMNGSYLACAVMLGVSSEAAFLDLAQSFTAWLPPNQQTRLSSILASKNSSFNQKFDEFRKRLDPQKPAIARHSQDLADSLTLTLDGIIEQIRNYRNNAGHPTGKRYERETIFLHLQMFAIMLRQLYDLKNIFDRKLATPI